MEKASSKEKKEVKEGIEYYTKNLRKRLKLDNISGEKVREYSEKMAVGARDFSLSFLPEKTRRHIINMNKEALMAVQSVIEEGVGILEKPKK